MLNLNLMRLFMSNMFQSTFKFLEIYKEMEEDPTSALISFLRSLGINQTSNKTSKSFYISLFKSKINKVNIASSIDTKRFQTDFTISIINITDSYIDFYFRKLGSQKSFQVSFDNVVILKQEDIQFISFKLKTSIKVNLPKTNGSIIIDKIEIKRL